MSLEQRLSNIEAMLEKICAALEARGGTEIAVLPNGMTEAQNDAACKDAIERTVDGDKKALTRFLKSGGKVPIGKTFWPDPGPRNSGRPAGSRHQRKESIQ